MSVFEAVNRLVVVTDDAHVCNVRKQIKKLLLCAIQILEFVNKDMGILASLCGRRICVEVMVQLGDDFTDKHRPMESQPS